MCASGSTAASPNVMPTLQPAPQVRRRPAGRVFSGPSGHLPVGSWTRWHSATWLAPAGEARGRILTPAGAWTKTPKTDSRPPRKKRFHEWLDGSFVSRVPGLVFERLGK
ncbi:hypothetical protein GCM10023081_40310 [Arthrobacter ginkgonis]|uniref:Uncharacterized protein n=1 Tax=Arthrobacter ginkgonis TaxID=1630594 RepID=A0ABP7D7H0_9MICC